MWWGPVLDPQTREYGQLARRIEQDSRAARSTAGGPAWGETTSMVPGLELLEPGRALCAQRASDQAAARRPSVLRLIGSAGS
jgi:hypothetical protein